MPTPQLKVVTTEDAQKAARDAWYELLNPHQKWVADHVRSTLGREQKSIAGATGKIIGETRRELTAEIAETRDEHAALRKELTETLAEQRQQHAEDLAEAKRQYAAALKETEARHAQTIADLSVRHVGELDEVRQEVAAHTERAVKEATTALRQELFELRKLIDQRSPDPNAHDSLVARSLAQADLARIFST